MRKLKVDIPMRARQPKHEMPSGARFDTKLFMTSGDIDPAARSRRHARIREGGRVVSTPEHPGFQLQFVH